MENANPESGVGIVRKTTGPLLESVCVNLGEFRVLHRLDLPVAAVLDALLPDPDRVMNEGTIFKQGTRNHSVRIALGGRDYFLKRYNCRGWGYRLGSLFRSSRAVRTWHAHLFFRNLGLPVQEPVLCLEQRSLRLLGRSYMLTEFVENSVSLMKIWPTLDAAEKEKLMLCLAGHLGRMHRAGGIHGDLKWYNILIRRDESGLIPYLVDLDGSRFFRKVLLRRVWDDVERFTRDLEKMEPDSRFMQLFLDAWQAGIALDESEPLIR